MIAEAAPTAQQPEKHEEFVRLDTSVIAPDCSQDRREFDMLALNELAASLASIGVKQPLIVRPLREPGIDREDDKDRFGGALFRLIGGERRWRAAQIAKLALVPCMVQYGLTDADVFVIQATENLQRKNLNLSEQITLCSRAVAMLTLDGAVERLSMSKPWISMRATMMGFSPEVRELVQTGVVNDIQIAHSLGQLMDIDATKAHRLIGEFIEPPLYRNGRPPSRADVASTLALAKQQADDALRRQEEKINAGVSEAQDALAKQFGLPRTDAAAGGASSTYQDLLTKVEDLQKASAAKQAEPKQTATEKRIAERRIKLRKLEPECAQLAEKLRIELNTALGVEVPANRHAVAWDKSFVIPTLAVDTAHLADELPDTAMDARYTAQINAPAATYALINENVMEPLTLRTFVGGVTDEQAAAIEKILGGPLLWKGQISGSGDHLRALYRGLTIDPEFVSKPDPKQRAAKPVASADPERELADWIKKTIGRRVGSRLKASEVHERYAADCAARGVLPLPLNDMRYGKAFQNAKPAIYSIRSNGIRYIDSYFKGDSK